VCIKNTCPFLFCVGRLHSVWTNCLLCGQVICEGHGPGPLCSFCGNDLFAGDAASLYLRQCSPLPALSNKRNKAMSLVARQCLATRDRPLFSAVLPDNAPLRNAQTWTCRGRQFSGSLLNGDGLSAGQLEVKGKNDVHNPPPRPSRPIIRIVK
jgi:hypothetical protein